MSSNVPSAAVLVVEDHDLARRSFVRMLGEHLAVVAVGSVAEARRAADRVEIVAGILADEHLPDGSGLAFAVSLRERDPGLPVLVASGDVDDELLRRVQRAGAQVLPKPVLDGTLADFAERCQNRVDPAGTYARKHRLSAREADVLRLLVDGVPLKQLPAKMGISRSTLRTYLERIRDKRGIRAVADIVRAIEGLRSSAPPPAAS